MGKRKRLHREALAAGRDEREIADTAKRIADDLDTGDRSRSQLSPRHVALLSTAVALTDGMPPLGKGRRR